MPLCASWAKDREEMPVQNHGEICFYRLIKFKLYNRILNERCMIFNRAERNGKYIHHTTISTLKKYASG